MKTTLAVACVAGISLVLTACGAPAESEPAPTVTSQQASASPTPGLPIGAGDGNTAISPDLPVCDKRIGSADSDNSKDGVAAPFPTPTITCLPNQDYSLDQAKRRVDDITKQVMMLFFNMYDTSKMNGKPLKYTDQQFVDGINSWNSAAQSAIDATDASDRAAVEAYVDGVRPTVERYPKVLTGS